jgi:ABC-2 type transport system permease protein
LRDIMWERIIEIIRKEFLQTLRDPRMRALLFVPPLIQLVIFGYAVNLDVEHTRTAWMDMDRTPESRDLLAAFSGSHSFRITALPSSEAEVREVLDNGDVQAVLRVLPGFGKDVLRGDPTAVQILIDGTNSNTAAIVSGYANQIVAAYTLRVLQAQQNSKSVPATLASGAPVAAPPSALIAQPRVWFNPDLKSQVYFVPGVVVNIIALVTIMLTSMSIVREKEIGTMEQLMVTPIRPIELMLGKLLPFAAVGIFEVILVVSAALLIFGTPLRGSVPFLFFCSVLFLLTTLGVGLFISTISHTQQQAMISSFFFFMPALLLSGFAFPIRNMPAAVQYLTFLNPVRYFMEIVRGLFLKGVGLSYLWPQVLALLVFGTAILGISALRFHKRLD